MLLNNAKNIMLGSQQVSKIMQGANLVWESVKYYDGIPCYIDNVYMPASSGTINDTVSDNNYFLAFCDLGESQKKVFFGYGGEATNSYGMRCFKNEPSLGEESSDYWTVRSRDRGITMLDRYCVFTVRKVYAKYFRVYDDDGIYYLKGSEV